MSKTTIPTYMYLPISDRFYTYMLMNSKDLFPRGSVSADVLLAGWGGPEFG